VSNPLVKAVLRSLLLGAAPTGLMGCVLALSGAYTPDPVPVGYEAPTPEGLAARAATLRAHLPEDFEVVVAAPYVVVTDAGPHAVDRAELGIRYARGELAHYGLTALPDHVVDLWLFADTESYRQGARDYLGEWPPSRSGYYAPKRHAVLVNAEAGYGAVIHEAAHPIITASFPSCPVWLDEGIASWLEHVEPAGPRPIAHDPDRDRLKRRLEQHRLPSLAALTVSTGREFYADPQRIAYGQARHVVLYLVSEGLLGAYVDEIQHRIVQDPTGMATLRDVTGDDQEPLQARWERFALGL